MPKLYARPAFLPASVTETAYISWLRRKCAAHVKRDRKRANHEITGLAYRTKMHAAVSASAGRDHYTGEELHWELIGTYCNESSKAGRSEYKASLALLPTIDHVLMEDGTWDFVVCAWRTNDAKNDLSHAGFLELCRKVIAHHDRDTLSSALSSGAPKTLDLSHTPGPKLRQPVLPPHRP